MDAKIMQRLAGYRAGAGVIDILVQLESSRMPSLEIKTLPMRGILPAKAVTKAAATAEVPNPGRSGPNGRVGNDGLSRLTNGKPDRPMARWRWRTDDLARRSRRGMADNSVFNVASIWIWPRGDEAAPRQPVFYR